MSIIYNNKTVAGKYKEQIVNEADTINAGLVKIATQEEVDKGENNTSAVTPYYLSTKQDKLVAGDGIVIDENLIECTIYPDEQTIVQNYNGTINCVGQLTKSGTIKFDWEGTEAEYTEAMKNGMIQPDWYCYITDDEIFTDYGDVVNQSLSNLKPEGEARFDSKSNIDLDNLSYVGENHFLHPNLDNLDETGTTIIDNKSNIDLSNLSVIGEKHFVNRQQITNCLLEVPQRIKYTLENGTLTIKAGSVVIVPYGTEDLTSQYPVGSVFINDNFKVYDTQFSSDRFSVWVELVRDCVVEVSADTTTKRRLFFMNLTTFFINAYLNTGSGAEDYTGSSNYVLYHTDENIMKHYSSSSGLTNNVFSFPLGLCSADGTYIIGTIDQIFNGAGYIGSHKWLDKGVKILCSNGRNEDGTLKNLEIVTEKFGLYTGGTGNVQYEDFYDADLGYVAHISQSKNTFVVNSLSELDDKAGAYAVAYVIPENKLYVHAVNEPWEHFIGAQVSCHVNINSDGSVSEFTPYAPFRAVDYNDLPIKSIGLQPATTISSISRTKPAVVVENYKSGYSWYRVWSDGWIEQGGQNSTASAEAKITLLKNFTATNYYVSLQLVNKRSGSQQNISPYDKTTDSFYRTCNGGTEYNNPIAWYACGY